MIPTLAQVCTLPADFADEIEQYAAGDCPAIEFWLTKLEQFVARHDLATVRALLDQHGLQTPAASFQGGLFQPDNAGFQDAWSSLLRRLALCQSLGVETLVVAGDIFDPLSQPLIERVRDRLQRIADAAATTNRKVAFEFQAAATFANNLETTLAADFGNRPPGARDLSGCLSLSRGSEQDRGPGTPDGRPPISRAAV